MEHLPQHPSVLYPADFGSDPRQLPQPGQNWCPPNGFRKTPGHQQLVFTLQPRWDIGSRQSLALRDHRKSSPLFCTQRPRGISRSRQDQWTVG